VTAPRPSSPPGPRREGGGSRRALTVLGEGAPAAWLALAGLLVGGDRAADRALQLRAARPSQILARMMSEYRLLSLHAAVTAAEVVAGAAGLGDDPDVV
jgi:hypothetical protein